MKKIIFAITLILTAANVSADLPYTTGEVTGYIASEANGKELFVFQTAGQPANGCNTTARFAVDDSSLLYKGTQAAVIAAYHSKSQVRVYYKDTCNALGNAADIRWVCVGNIPC